MCLGSAPKAPDPIATAQAQNAVNQDALKGAAQLNQINQTGPFGSINWSGTIGSPDRTQITSLTPDLQRLLDGMTGSSNTLTDIANERLAGADRSSFQMPDNPVGYLDQRASNPLQLLDNRANSPLQTSFQGTQDKMTTGVDAPALMMGFDSGGQAQRSLDFSGAPSLNTDFAGLSKQAQDASYNKSTQYLDPQFGQQEDALRSRLAAQGITQGSDAYNTEMENFGRTRQSAYDDARNSAILTGNQQENALFGQNLAARQQGVGEATTQGTFGNQALAQQFGQNQAQAQFYNQAQAQGFGQGMDNAQLNNAAQNSIFGQNMAQGQFYNDAQGQQLNQGLDILNYNNGANSQMFNQGLQLQNYNQNLYQQNLQNQLTGRNQNINEAMAYLNGTPISPQNPTFQAVPGSTAAQGSPDAVSLAGNNYQSASAARSALLSSIFGSLGRVGSAGMGG